MLQSAFSSCDLPFLYAASRAKSVVHNGRSARVSFPSPMVPLGRYGPRAVENVARILRGCRVVQWQCCGGWSALVRIRSPASPEGEHRGSHLMLKKSPGFLKGGGLSLTRVRHLKSPVSLSRQRRDAAFGSTPFRPRGFALPFQIYRLPRRRGTE